jgi:hypothetical protein
VSGWTQEFENALAWFAAAPSKVTGAVGEAIDAATAGIESATQSVKDTVAGAAEWVWGVLQGDFAEEQSTAQIVTSTVISMIPYVDQLCDARDIVANCMKIYESSDKDKARGDKDGKEGDNTTLWNWVALILTLIGLFPTLGSFFKGCFKVLFGCIRKALAKSGGAKAGEAVWKIVSPALEAGIAKLNDFLARPAVRKYIAEHRIDNVYKAIADKIREVAKSITPSGLSKLLDEYLAKLSAIVGFVQKWGGEALVSKAGHLLTVVDSVRRKADAALARALAPAQDLLDRTAKRLDMEHKAHYAVSTNAWNPRSFKHITEDAEHAAYKKKKEPFVDDVREPRPHPSAELKQYEAALARGEAVIEQGYRDGRLRIPFPGAARQPAPDLARMGKQFKNFGKDLRVDVLAPGTKLYRVVDPGSLDDSIYWMTEEEFRKLAGKDDWRRRFAVWAGWNKDGEYVTYTVPDEGLVVWRGQAATQAHRKGDFMLEGGAEQIAVDPKWLDRKRFSDRQPTGWGYDDLGEKADLTGVPLLQHNYMDYRKIELKPEDLPPGAPLKGGANKG